MPDNAIHGVVGADGGVPIYQPEARWCLWGLHEIFDGNIGLNKYIPKVNDYVIDYNNYTTYVVDALDPITLIPTLREIRPAGMSYIFNENDILFGVGPGTQADTYRVYLDKSVTPFVMAVDARLKVYGTMCSYAKIFKSTLLNSEGEVISKVYDNSGNFISNNIPLELVTIDNHTNYSSKIVSVCNTVEDLPDGEVVTVVFYSDNGHVVSKRQLLVENTSFIRSLNISQKYVSHITMDCPFISTTVENRIEFPLNIPLNALNLMGVVHYSDGSTLKIPVDGNKFKIFGLEQYVSTIVGQKINLVLSYALGTNETAYNGITVNGKYITEPYELITINPNNSYAVKLFGYPVWIDVNNGYTMNWWLFNLERNIYFDVTPYVSFAVNTGAYNPKGYGLLQRKAVNINLRDISGAFKPFVHTQLVDIILNGTPDLNATAWTVSHESVSLRPAYGEDVFATKITSNILNIACGLNTKQEWIDKIYNSTYPLINNTTELVPLEPTHFIIKYNNNTVEKTIDEWNVDVNMGIVINDYSTISIRFIKRTASGDMQLSMSAMIVKP